MSEQGSKFPRWIIWIVILLAINGASWMFDLGFWLY